MYQHWFEIETIENLHLVAAIFDQVNAPLLNKSWIKNK